MATILPRPPGFIARLIGQVTFQFWELRQYTREIRVFFRFPTHLQIVAAKLGAKIGDRRRVVLFGIPYADWNASLANPALWEGIEDVSDVIRVPALLLVSAIAARLFGRRTIGIPAKIAHAGRLPRGYRALSPSRDSIAALADKDHFSAYMHDNGLTALCPAFYASAAKASYPCVMKRADLSSSLGVVVVSSAEEVDTLRNRPMFIGRRVILQELIAGTVEYATYCVCKDGRILWHCTFVTEVADPHTIKSEDNVLRRTTIVTPQPVLDQIERVLAPLNYRGPCNLDYKLAANGDMRIFEINPRLGGSLMLPQYVDELRQALGCIVENAA